MSMFLPPLADFEQITLEQANECLVAWGHKMGPLNRPTGGGWVHALRHHGKPVAIAAADVLIRETSAGFTRDEAIELARVCAVRRDLNRVVLRLWREFVFPCLGRPWAVSYQDAALHSGDLYRFDGWVKVGRSSSGTDKRSGRKGRNKVIWGWCADATARSAGARP